jgi:hypothetical protein
MVLINNGEKTKDNRNKWKWSLSAKRRNRRRAKWSYMRRRKASARMKQMWEEGTFQVHKDPDLKIKAGFCPKCGCKFTIHS